MNVIRLVVYDSVLQLRALQDIEESIMLLDRTTWRIEGYLDDICLTVGGSYVTADFTILHTGYGPKNPIILGRPFLHTVKASIYVAAANMHFDILSKKQRFTFNPLYPRRQSRRSKRGGYGQVNSLEILKTNFYKQPIIKGWQDASWPVKKGDPGRPLITVSIHDHELQALCDLGSAVNIIPMCICNHVLQLFPQL